MFISNLLLLLACVVPLASTLPHPISSNIAVYSSVSVTCGQSPCDYPQEESALINDNNNDTVWDSIGTVGSEYHITLTFIQEYEVSEVYITFPTSSPLPPQWSVEVSLENETYTLVEYFATECVSDPAVDCTQINEQIGPFTVKISSVNLQDKRFQFIRINLASFATNTTDTLLYSLSEIEVYGECSCNGYGRECQLQQDSTELYECGCGENTCGNHCEYCCEGYQLMEYASRKYDPSFTCKRCDNCTITLLQELDTQIDSFNNTADRVDLITLTIASQLGEIASLIETFSILYQSTATYLLETSSLELAVYGTSTNYSIEGDAVPLQCVGSELIIREGQTQLRGEIQAASQILLELTEGNQIISNALDSQDQLIDLLYQNQTRDDISLTEYIESLTASLSRLSLLTAEFEQKRQEAKEQLSIIISNHRFINATLFDTISTRIRALIWQQTIINTSNILRPILPRVETLYGELVALFGQIEVLIGYANVSLSLFSDIEGYRGRILELVSRNMELSANISRVSSELESLNASIYLLLEEITQLITEAENCLDSVRISAVSLANRNTELEALNSGTETELKQFLNTVVIESADTYMLSAEIYARELIGYFEQIYYLVRYAPDTGVSLSLTEDQLLVAIGVANRVVAERERLEYIINRVQGDNIFTDISLLKQLIDRLNQSADDLSRESTAVLNALFPFNVTCVDLRDQLTELKRRVAILLVNSSIQYREDEYTSELPVLRAQLETDRTLLSELEPSLNSTILELLAAKALLPNISLLNNQTTQLRRTRLYEIRDLKESTFYIATELNDLLSNKTVIKTRNYDILSRLQKVYSRLSRVHNDLQLPKAPLRLDGTMVVSLQPPPTEQLENATYSTDFSFYFEPVKNALTDAPQSTFLFFYAGPAILSSSTNTSVLSSEDYIAIVSNLGVMGYRARLAGQEFAEDLESNQMIRSNSKYIVRIKRVGSAFRFELTTPTNRYQIAPSLSEETLHKFAFKPTQNTAYYIGGHPDDVLIADSLQSLAKFRGCVYLALTLRWNLYSLWDTRYHTNLLTDQSGLDCIRHGATQGDFDVDGLSFNGNGHAYVRNGDNSPIIELAVTPLEHDALILTAFGRNSDNKKFIFSFYLRDKKFAFDISYNEGSRETFQSDLITEISTRYDIKMFLSGGSTGVRATIQYEGGQQEVTLQTSVTGKLYKAEVLLFGGISQLAVEQSSHLEGWTTDYYKNLTGCIADIVILRTILANTLVSASFSLTAGGTTGVSLGCPMFPIPEYSVTKTDTTGYLKFDLLAHEGVTGGFTQFYHGVNNYELLPGAVGTLATYPLDLRSPYSLGLIVSKPKFIGDRAVLIHASDLNEGITVEVSIDVSLNVTLSVTRNGVAESVSSPLDTTKKKPMHAITVHSLGAGGLELYVDEFSPVTLAGAVSLVLPVELTANQNLLIGGNSNPQHSYVGCIKEVALYDSLLNLGLGTFVPTGSSPPGSDGIVHDMCGVHPYNGLVYGGARALPYPFDFAAAVRES